MLKKRFRVWLPLVFGLVSIGLMALALHRTGWCDAFDEAQLDWRCEGPDFILSLVNAPAMVLIRPLANLWNAAPVGFFYLLLFPFIVIWWWFVGTRLDFGMLGIGRYSHRRAWLGTFIALPIVLTTLLAGSLWSGVRFFRSYPYLHVNPYLASIEQLRMLPLRLWLLILIFAFSVAALRIAQGGTGQSGRKLTTTNAMRIAVCCFCVYGICAVATIWHSKRVERRRQEAYDLARVIIRGRIVDERGAPVYAIEVDLIPVHSDGTVPQEEAASDFTNKSGEYELSPEQAGKYVVAVQWNAPPSTAHPFLTRYYPDAADLQRAETLEITAARHMVLRPIRLQTLGLAKVPVSVSWSDGKPEPDAYLLFRNSSYPQYGAVGREALHADESGMIYLPRGFDYIGNAQVDCDAGPKIGNAYTPELRFSLRSVGTQIRRLHFVLPGSPCKVWHPQ